MTFSWPSFVAGFAASCLLFTVAVGVAVLISKSIRRGDAQLSRELNRLRTNPTARRTSRES